MSLLHYNLSMLFVLWRRVCNSMVELILCLLNTHTHIVRARCEFNSTFIRTIQPCHFYSMHSHMLTLSFVGMPLFLPLFVLAYHHICCVWLAFMPSEWAKLSYDVFFFLWKTFIQYVFCHMTRIKEETNICDFRNEFFVLFTESQRRNDNGTRMCCCVDNTYTHKTRIKRKTMKIYCWRQNWLYVYLKYDEAHRKM